MVTEHETKLLELRNMLIDTALGEPLNDRQQWELTRIELELGIL